MHNIIFKKLTNSNLKKWKKSYKNNWTNKNSYNAGLEKLQEFFVQQKCSLRGVSLNTTNPEIMTKKSE